MRLAIYAISYLLVCGLLAQEPKPTSVPVQSSAGSGSVEGTMEVDKNRLVDVLKDKKVPMRVTIKNNSDGWIVINPQCDSQNEGVVIYGVTGTAERKAIFPVIKDAPPAPVSQIMFISIAPGKTDSFTIFVPVGLIDTNLKEIVCRITATKLKTNSNSTIEMYTNTLPVSGLHLK